VVIQIVALQLVVETGDQVESFQAIPGQVLLLGGGKSPAYLRVALNRLEAIIPHTLHVELPGLGHAAAWNTDRGGSPTKLAPALKAFFAPPGEP
jgi:hypothetical protein